MLPLSMSMVDDLVLPMCWGSEGGVGADPVRQRVCGCVVEAQKGSDAGGPRLMPDLSNHGASMVSRVSGPCWATEGDHPLMGFPRNSRLGPGTSWLCGCGVMGLGPGMEGAGKGCQGGVGNSLLWLDILKGSVPACIISCSSRAGGAVAKCTVNAWAESRCRPRSAPSGKAGHSTKVGAAPGPELCARDW